ncbi:hypothetical protein WJX77_006691 [Trebouxia sp. C0004]
MPLHSLGVCMSAALILSWLCLQTPGTQSGDIAPELTSGIVRRLREQLEQAEAELEANRSVIKDSKVAKHREQLLSFSSLEPGLVLMSVPKGHSASAKEVQFIKADQKNIIAEYEQTMQALSMTAKSQETQKRRAQKDLLKLREYLASSSGMSSSAQNSADLETSSLVQELSGVYRRLDEAKQQIIGLQDKQAQLFAKSEAETQSVAMATAEVVTLKQELADNFEHAQALAADLASAQEAIHQLTTRAESHVKSSRKEQNQQLEDVTVFLEEANSNNTALELESAHGQHSELYSKLTLEMDYLQREVAALQVKVHEANSRASGAATSLADTLSREQDLSEHMSQKQAIEAWLLGKVHDLATAEDQLTAAQAKEQDLFQELEAFTHGNNLVFDSSRKGQNQQLEDVTAFLEEANSNNAALEFELESASQTALRAILKALIENGVPAAVDRWMDEFFGLQDLEREQREGDATRRSLRDLKDAQSQALHAQSAAFEQTLNDAKTKAAQDILKFAAALDESKHKESELVQRLQREQDLSEHLSQKQAIGAGLLRENHDLANRLAAAQAEEQDLVENLACKHAKQKKLQAQVCGLASQLNAALASPHQGTGSRLGQLQKEVLSLTDKLAEQQSKTAQAEAAATLMQISVNFTQKAVMDCVAKKLVTAMPGLSGTVSLSKAAVHSREGMSVHSAALQRKSRMSVGNAGGRSPFGDMTNNIDVAPNRFPKLLQGDSKSRAGSRFGVPKTSPRAMWISMGVVIKEPVMAVSIGRDQADAAVTLGLALGSPVRPPSLIENTCRDLDTVGLPCGSPANPSSISRNALGSAAQSLAPSGASLSSEQANCSLPMTARQTGLCQESQQLQAAAPDLHAQQGIRLQSMEGQLGKSMSTLCSAALSM